MASTRLVTSQFNGPDGEPLVGFPVAFTVTPSSYTPSAHYPELQVKAVTDANGTLSVELATDVPYKVQLLGALRSAGAQFAIVVPDGDGPIALEDVRGLHGVNPAAPDVTAMIEQVVLDYLSAGGSLDGGSPHSSYGGTP